MNEIYAWSIGQPTDEWSPEVVAKWLESEEGESWSYFNHAVLAETIPVALVTAKTDDDSNRMIPVWTAIRAAN